MHHKYNFNSKICIKSSSSQDLTISGYANVFNIVDHHNDITVKGAFEPAINSADNIKFLWQHDHLKPIGIIKSLSEDDYGLKMEATINSKIIAGNEAIELVKQGAIDSLSIGFLIKSYSYNDLGQRIITEGHLLEISLVTFPANGYAQISNIAKTDRYLDEITEIKSELRKLYFLSTKTTRRD